MNERHVAPEAGEVLGELLGRIYGLNRLAATRAPDGYSPSVYRTVGVLADLGTQRVGDLASAVHVSQPGMTKIVHALSERGAVERRPDPADSRATLVSVTAEGRRLLAERTAQIVEHLLPDFAQLTEPERATLWDAVDILRKYTPGESAAPRLEEK